MTENSKNGLEEVIEKSGLTPQQLRELKNYLKSAKKDEYIPKVIPEFGKNHVRIGVIGDTHITSVYFNEKFLTQLISTFEKEKVDMIIQTGDITDGENMRFDHRYYLRVQGHDNAVKLVSKTIPKMGVPFYFIGGNHDESYVKHTGIDICYWVSKERPDLQYLGMNIGLMQLGPNKKTKLAIFHPHKGTAKGQSYQQQELADFFESEEKPHMLIVGHYHKADYIHDRNIRILQAGCTQNKSDFALTKQLQFHLRGWLTDIYMKDDGSIELLKLKPLDYIGGGAGIYEGRTIEK